MKTTRRTVGLLVALMLVAPLLSACSGGASGRTVITFFQFKPEAQAYFQDLAQQFEEANPNVRVVVDNPADPETALRTRLVKNDVPDVMTLNANGTFGEFASAKIFRDFQDDPSLDDVNPAYLKVIGALGAGGKGEVNGVPFAANASGLLYNEDLFAKHDVAVPKTFDELIAAAKKFKEAGVTPFYGMLADAWTAQSPLAPLSSQLQPADFFPQRFDDKTSFAKGWQATAGELAELYKYTQPDPLSKGYEDGTAAFARGESAMLLLGSYAVPQIRAGKPKFTIGSMALPATNDPSKTTLVSGVDVVITAARNGEHPKEVDKFIDFLMQKKVMRTTARPRWPSPPSTDWPTTTRHCRGCRATSSRDASSVSPTTSSSRRSPSRRCCRPSCSPETRRASSTTSTPTGTRSHNDGPGAWEP